MPELPEVETTRAGIAAHLEGRTLTGWTIREPRLRWPVSLPPDLRGACISAVARRGKYLVIKTNRGALILHLGMSGSLRVLDQNTAPLKHDHVDLLLDSGRLLRLNDPRRFGSLHFTADEPSQHWLLAKLGPEPLSADFHGAYLFEASRRRRVAVKNFLMDSQVVVGVGNIYANEALFRAGIRPGRAAGRVSRPRYQRLVETVREVLMEAIEDGGTTLRDFVNERGQPGYFAQSLTVYGRGGEPCFNCGESLAERRLGGRATVYCRRCQT
jgi:formamidopyrimidine-DNA glycosylase